MGSNSIPAVPTACPPPPPPRWIGRLILQSQIDASFAAGANLALLCTAMSQPLPFRGALSERLALKVAGATNRAQGRPEDADQIRDEWWLRPRAEQLSPAASVFEAWRRLGSLRGGLLSLSPADLSEIAALFGRPLSCAGSLALETIKANCGSIANPVTAAATAAGAMIACDPHQEATAHFIADVVLADRLNWSRPLPLLAGSVGASLLREGGRRRRTRPEDTSWHQVVAAAYALSAGEALRVVHDLAVRADALLAHAPKLRAKPAGKVVQSLLDHTCLAGSRRIGNMSDRAMRRIYDRLVGARLIRELTGRSTFRLYGL